MLKRLFLCLLFVIVTGLSIGVAQTQVPTTQGTEFWVSFMRNGYRNRDAVHLTLIASAKENCQVTVTNPHTGYTNTFSVPDQGVRTLEISDADGYNDQKGGKAYKGLLVTSTDTISLYVANEADNSYDAANVLPVNALGCQYMVQSNKSVGEQSNHASENRASFMIIATEDDTQVQITPTCETWDSHPAGQPYEVSLRRGECYHVLNKNTGSTTNSDGDFSGTRIESANEKPIAVFNGNCITSVPGGTTSGFDHVFEQAMPIDNWGKSFVVTSTNAPSYYYLLNDYVKITALYDNTTVLRDQMELCHLNAGECFVFEMNLTTEPCTFLESDSPIAVYLYNHSHRTTGTTSYGDPSMVWISPVEQTVYEVTFSTFQAEKVESHYVNIVCYTSHVTELTYDNNIISTSFSIVPTAHEFSYARIEVSPGAHTIRCPGGFVAHVYGMGPNEGYAYTVGSSAKLLTKQLYVNEILSTELPDGYSTCLDDATIQFRTEFNYDFDHVTWDFGDGSPSEVGDAVSHTYTTSGDFDVVAVVYRLINGVIQPSGELTVTVHVNPQIEMYVTDSTCSPVYHFHGKDFAVPYFGDAVFPGDEGCDTVYHMNIMEGSSLSFVSYDTACMEYMWFDTLRYESGTYVVVTNQPGGCDSLYILHLTIGNPPENPERWLQSCDTYYWHGTPCPTSGEYHHSFTSPEGCVYDSTLHFSLIPAGETTIEVDTCDAFVWMGDTYDELGTHQYIKTIIGDNGCESQLILNLTLHASASFERIVGLTQVAAANNFWPGEYNYYLDDSTGIDFSRITWELLDNDGSDPWKLVLHGSYCTVTACSMGMRVLRVSSGDGECDKERFITINSSGYGIGEEELDKIEIYPNPTRDRVIVKGCDMDVVNVYSLMGQKLKSVSALGNNEVSLEMGDLPQTLYLVEVCTKRGNKTRLVSVIK